ncbi:RNA polymerase sigma-70 factor (ECF subfamily) [Arthrobacter sp. CAN_A212]|uniref:sigma-70 family RNA polymerase sigma factor n=1 Tax=Arthrobacter sp. CAN_A212 TaxID=2787719 RepID=UPI0018CB4319
MNNFERPKSGPGVRAVADRAALTGLLLRTADGDREAFTAFYHHTAGQVNGLARRVIIDGAISYDTTQEVFLVVWQDAHKYSPAAGTPLAWLMTITHRRAVDQVRTEQGHINREANWGAATLTIEFDEAADAIGRVEAQSVLASMKTLSHVQREAISLAYYGELTYREVAEKLDLPLPTVKSRIRDGLLQLRSCLEAASAMSYRPQHSVGFPRC